MIGMTLCSGIGAPEMAAPWVDWRFASEIEAFPRAVLQHRFDYKLPDDHNQGDPLLWGDMTEVSPELLRECGIPLPDVLVAGTPCQAFSIAGLRNGINDARGNLTLKFVETCHAIVDARPDGRLVVLWENVPGVLSDKGNAFGCFLGGLVGAVDALPPPNDESWPGEGMVQGPRARAAWAVLDAQFFGVAQRRRRVFVVIDFANCVDPAAVLLEPESLRGNPPSRGKAGEGVARGFETGPHGGGFTDVAPTLDTSCKDGPLRAQIGAGVFASHDPAATLQTTCDDYSRADSFNMIAHHAFKASHYTRGKDGAPSPVAPPLSADADRGDQDTLVGPVAGTICKDSFSGGASGRPEGAAAGHFIPVAFGSKDHGADAMTDLSPTLRAGGHAGSHANAGVPPAIAIQERAVSENPNHGPDGAGFRDDDAAYTLEGRPTTQAVAFDMRGREGGAMPEGPHDTANIRAESGGSSRSYIAHPWAVRRLTPTECARLQGFPDDHAQIPWRNKPAEDCPDGPQYKAYGNSMAVPVIKYLMDRIRISWN